MSGVFAMAVKLPLLDCATKSQGQWVFFLLPRSTWTKTNKLYFRFTFTEIISLKTAQNVEMYYYCKHAQTIKLIITFRFSGWCRHLSGAYAFFNGGCSCLCWSWAMKEQIHVHLWHRQEGISDYTRAILNTTTQVLQWYKVPFILIWQSRSR